MKKAFTTWYNYLIALGIAAVVIGSTLIPYFAIADTAKYTLNQAAMLEIFIGIVIFGLGFIIQDLFRASVRHKTKNWNNPLDEKSLNTAWAIFCPTLLGGLSSVLAGGIISIFFR
ncbi:MAG: hypothetical protein K6E11_04330 [Bacilli bacterium]|nr:hypothetical protein [Bacilli bacterium]